MPEYQHSFPYYRSHRSRPNMWVPGFVREGLIAWWNFNEGAGDIVHDFSGSLNHATWSGAGGGSNTVPTWQVNNRSSRWSMNFDGTDDYLIVTDPTAIQIGTGDYTVTVWARVDAGTGVFLRDRADGAAGSGVEGFYFRYNNSTTRPEVLLEDSAGNYKDYRGSINAALIDTINHYAFTWKNSTNTLNLFTNGRRDNSTISNNDDMTGSDISPAGRLDIGRRPDGAQYLQGNIRDLRIYNRALHKDEIVQIMSGIG